MRPRYKHGGIYAYDLRPYRDEFAYFVSFRVEMLGIDIEYNSRQHGAKEAVVAMHALNYFTKDLDKHVYKNADLSDYYTFPFLNFLGGDGFFKDDNIIFIKCMSAAQLPINYKLPIYKVCLLGVFAHYRQMLKLYKGFVDVVDVEMNIWVGRHIEDVKNLPWIMGGIASTKSLCFEICNYRYRQEGKRFEECYDLSKSDEDFFGIMNDLYYDNTMYRDISPADRGIIQVDWKKEKPSVFPGYDDLA